MSVILQKVAQQLIHSFKLPLLLTFSIIILINTKSSFLMNNVIATNYDKPAVISLKPRLSIVSPLKIRENSSNLPSQQPNNTKRHMTRSFILNNDNHKTFASMTQTKKQRIVLKKNQNYKYKSKIQEVQPKQRMGYVSLISENQRTSNRTSKHLHISIDLDRIRSEQKKETKQTLITDHSQLEPEKPKHLEFAFNKQPKGKSHLKVDLSAVQVQNTPSKQTIAKEYHHSSRRKNSSKQIRQNLMTKSATFIRPKSLDTIITPQIQQTTIKNEDKTKNLSTQTSNKTQTAPSEEQTLKALFKKLTKNNLPYQNWINYLNLTYQQLTIDELHFIGILLERVQPRYLNAMDYLTFKFKITQTCQKEFEELMYYQRINK